MQYKLFDMNKVSKEAAALPEYVAFFKLEKIKM